MFHSFEFVLKLNLTWNSIGRGDGSTCTTKLKGFNKSTFVRISMTSSRFPAKSNIRTKEFLHISCAVQHLGYRSLYVQTSVDSLWVHQHGDPDIDSRFTIRKVAAHCSRSDYTRVEVWGLAGGGDCGPSKGGVCGGCPVGEGGDALLGEAVLASGLDFGETGLPPVLPSGMFTTTEPVCESRSQHAHAQKRERDGKKRVTPASTGASALALEVGRLGNLQ